MWKWNVARTESDIPSSWSLAVGQSRSPNPRHRSPSLWRRIFNLGATTKPPAPTEKVQYGWLNISVYKKGKLSLRSILDLREAYLLTHILSGLYCTFFVGGLWAGGFAVAQKSKWSIQKLGDLWSEAYIERTTSRTSLPRHCCFKRLPGFLCSPQGNTPCSEYSGSRFRETRPLLTQLIGATSDRPWMIGKQTPVCSLCCRRKERPLPNVHPLSLSTVQSVGERDPKAKVNSRV